MELEQTEMIRCRSRLIIREHMQKQISWIKILVQVLLQTRVENENESLRRTSLHRCFVKFRLLQSSLYVQLELWMESTSEPMPYHLHLSSLDSHRRSWLMMHQTLLALGTRKTIRTPCQLTRSKTRLQTTLVLVQMTRNKNCCEAIPNLI